MQSVKLGCVHHIRILVRSFGPIGFFLRVSSHISFSPCLTFTLRNGFSVRNVVVDKGNLGYVPDGQDLHRV